jgi:hypothetical protein
MKATQPTFDEAQAEQTGKETVTGDNRIKSMCWFIAPSLMTEQHRQEWERSMKAGIERFSTRFEKLPVKVVLHTVPLPEGWDRYYPDVEFRQTKSILPGHFVLCNDPDEFFGTKDRKNLCTGQFPC